MPANKPPAARGRKPAAPGHRPPPAAHAVRVRMYRHGLGDCFLLAFPVPGAADFKVLIDCGVILGTPRGAEAIRAVVADLKAATAEGGTPTLDVLIATHEHWDHLSAFADARDEFAAFEIGQVWMAWTEDPADEVAAGYRRARAEKLTALRLCVAHLRTHLTASGALGAGARPGTADAEFRRIAEVLSFFGIDPDEFPAAGLAARAGTPGPAGETPKLGVTDAMDWCRDRPDGRRKFLKPGETFEPKGLKGVRVYVLGPPTDRAQLFKDLPTKSGRETYADPESPLAGASRAFLGADVGPPGPGRPAGDFDAGAPFDRKYRVEPDQAAGTDFYRAHYLGAGPGDADAWRRIDGVALGDAAAFALQLDGDTNNTSLALAFELPDGRVLLFPGDAQVGNWESWHADAGGTKRVFAPAGREVTAADLLARTAVYKVGHHGSHNATLRALGLEMMPKGRFVALVPVDTYVAHEKKGWGKMPFEPLLAALHEQTGGRVIVADQPLSALPKGTFGPDEAVDSDATIAVAGPENATVARPLYVDYFLPSEPETGRDGPH